MQGYLINTVKKTRIMYDEKHKIYLAGILKGLDLITEVHNSFMFYGDIYKVKFSDN